MSDKKVPDSTSKIVTEHIRESVKEVPLTAEIEINRDTFVSNSRPAPPNPHRDDGEGGKDKKP